MRTTNYGSHLVKVCIKFLIQYLPNIQLQQKLSNINNLSESYIDTIISNYLNDVNLKTWESKGWPLTFPNYKMSKIALHSFTRLLAKDLDQRPDGPKIYVNCIHPGLVQTEMSNRYGNLTPQQGAEHIVRVALMAVKDCPSGQFFYEDKIDEF